MNNPSRLWNNKRALRVIAIVVLFAFAFNLVIFDLARLLHLNHKQINISVAQAAVSDRDGLGMESFWHYAGKDLGGGWAYSVNTFTGNLTIQKGLVGIPGRGISLSEGLVYNALSTQVSALGRGWKLRSDLFVEALPDGNVVFKDGDGTNHRFVKNPDNTYKSPDGAYLELTKVDATTFTIKDRAKSIYRFQNGLLSSITDENGNQTSFSYDSNNRITSMTDPSGRKLTYSYTSMGWLNKITDPASRTISFSYYADGNPAYVQDQQGKRTYLYYDIAQRVKKITDPNSHKTEFFYDSNGKAIKINDARSSLSKQYSTSFSYDTNLLKTTVADPLGKTITLTHNSNGNLVKSEDGASVIKNLAWDKNNLIKRTDANGETIITYDANGNVSSVTDTLSEKDNATASFTYDSSNNLTSATDSNNNKFEGRYDPKSNQLSSSNPKKEADANTYDAYGNKTSSTNTGAPTYNLLQNGSFEWLDANGLPQFWSATGNTAAVSVDQTTAMFGKSSVKISSGTETDAWLCSSKIPVSAGEQLTLSTSVRIDSVVSSSGYGAGIGIQYLDANLNKVRWDTSDTIRGSSGTTMRVLTSAVPTGAVYAVAELYLYHASGTVWFDGAQLELPIYDTSGQILTKFDYVENSSFEAGNSYWHFGGVSGAASINTDPQWAWADSKSAKINLTTSGDAWVYSSSIPVRPEEPLTLSGFIKTQNIAGTGARVQIKYFDSNNNSLSTNATALQTGTQDYTRYAIAVTPPAGTSYAIVYGQVITSTGTAYFDNIKLVQRATSKYTYDAAGNYVTQTEDPLGNRVNLAYDSAGNCIQVDDAKGNITRFSYDTLNNLTSVTDALGGISRYDYDPVSLQLTYRDARSSSPIDNTFKTSYAYNEINQILSTTDPLGKKTTYTYDDSGNLASHTLPDSKKTLFTYDAANRLSQKSYSAEPGTYAFSYDGAGNLTRVTDNAARSFAYTYNKANMPTSLTDIFGYKLTYGIDKNANIISISDSSGKEAKYTYGVTNQLLALTDTAGRQTTFRYDEEGRPFEVRLPNGIQKTYVYDNLGRLMHVQDRGNPNNAYYHYAYDANGNITYTTWVGSFTYDTLNRLTSFTNIAGVTTTYTHDAVGNLTKKGSKTFTFNAANQITNAGFSYDVNGNQTSDGNFNYQYNSENQLVKVTKVADGSTVATYEYDYRGLRTRKVTAAGTVRYHWDAHNRLIRESDGSNNTIALYVYNVRGQLHAIEKGGQVYYAHMNLRGDILAITDVSANKVATYDYGPWGEPLGKTGTFEQPFRYAGYIYDDETGLYYQKSRYYSPDLGRFLTKDALKGVNTNPRTLNLYVYASNNPIVNIELDGYASVRVSKGLVFITLNNEEAQTLAEAYAFGGGAMALGGMLVGGPTGGVGWVLALVGAAVALTGGAISLANVGHGVIIVLNPARILNPLVGLYPIVPKKKRRAAWSEPTTANSAQVASAVTGNITSSSMSSQSSSVGPGLYVVGNYSYRVVSGNEVYCNGIQLTTIDSADAAAWLGRQ